MIFLTVSWQSTGIWGTCPVEEKHFPAFCAQHLCGPSLLAGIMLSVVICLLERPVREADSLMGAVGAWIWASGGRWWCALWTRRCWCRASVSGNVSHSVYFALLMTKQAQESLPTASPKHTDHVFSSAHYLNRRLAKSVELTLAASTSCISRSEDGFE